MNLDDMLKDDRYLDDAGFSARVVSALPARRKAKWLRPVVLGAAALAGLAVALWVLPSENYLAASFAQLLRARSFAAIPLLPVVTMTLIFWATISAAVSES